MDIFGARCCWRLLELSLRGLCLPLLHVPYAALLAVLFFFLYFLPVIGTYIIAALCILAALSQGWVVTLIVAVFLVLLLGVVMGEVLAPRIFSSTVGGVHGSLPDTFYK